jgi:hypothetical protein
VETVVSLPAAVITAIVPTVGFSLDKSRSVVKDDADDDKYAKKGGDGGSWVPSNVGPKRVYII